MINLPRLVVGRHASGLPDRVAHPIHMTIAWLCAGLLVMMMILTVSDVIGRYVFSKPVQGSTELTELMLMAVIFLGLPAATLDREHVTVDLVTDHLRGKLELLRRPVILAVSAVVQGVIGWRLWIAAGQIASYGGITASLEIPVAPFGYGAAILCAISVLITCAQVFYPPLKEGA
jgi:TRAP-type C4-dicarboxylate transport system permease small subunit